MILKAEKLPWLDIWLLKGYMRQIPSNQGDFRQGSCYVGQIATLSRTGMF